MDVNIIEEIEPQVSQTERNIKKKIAQYKFYPRILLLGTTGNGKSSLTASLTGKGPTIVMGEGNHIELDGIGIASGSTSVTTEPCIFIDTIKKRIICDCPGFEDTKGMVQEIINSFANDCLLDNSENHIKIKILLVISASEIDSKRGKDVSDTIERMKKMFPNPKDLKEGIGIVISKGLKNIKGTDYIARLKNKAPDDLCEWCDYFLANTDQVFTFPAPSNDDIGKVYEFDDKQKIINFISGNYIIDPEHKITLSENSFLELKNLRSDHYERVKEIVIELFEKINNQYQKEKLSNILGQWLEIMHKLLDSKIKKTKDFRNAIQRLVPNNDQYLEYFIMLEEFEAFDAFIDRVYEVDDASSLQETFRFLAHSAIQELENSQLMAEKTEMNAKYMIEKQKTLNEFQRLTDENKRKMDELRATLAKQVRICNEQKNEIDQKNNENLDLLNQINQKNNEIWAKNNQISNQNSRINDLERQLHPPPRCNIY